MLPQSVRARALKLLVLLAALAAPATAQVSPVTQQAASDSSSERPPTPEDTLRGEYGRYRANNDLLFYHLDIRVDPEKKSIAGKNTIRFRMLADDTRIQLDLYANLTVDRILFEGRPLKYERLVNTVFVDFPATLTSGHVYTIDFYYSGTP